MEPDTNIFDTLPIEHNPEWMSDPVCEDPPAHCSERNHYRSIWISDVHLGTSGARADLLCDFLKYNTCDTLYLVGDIIDGWRMKNRAFWPQEHINVVRRILTRSKRGSKIVYITGNHDEFLRRYSGMSFGNIHLVDEYVHKAPNGKQYWVVHGDSYDAIVFNKKWLVIIGDVAYDVLLKLNVGFNLVRRIMGMRQWSLSAYLKNKARNAFSIISSYEATLADQCSKRGYDGVICGHIHFPDIKQINSVQYANCGDWVESCSALIETNEGDLAIIQWPQQAQNSVILAPAQEADSCC